MNLFRSEDIIFSAYAFAEGHSLIECGITDQGRVEFRFEQTPSLGLLLDNFYCGDALVEPGLFVSSYRFLKGTIFDVRKKLKMGEAGT